ncbi:deoxyribodipyrimidine photo-lyase [Rheinheimera sp.]|uniref:deoxyribodipyrimidine photo-lyase n=1 Tax=Rheinheimera sp. TaxID=1869214 RepID=UPI004048E9D3
MTALVWFKRDLRVEDHLPLLNAAKAGAVLPVYIIEPDYWQQHDVSLRHWQFMDLPARSGSKTAVKAAQYSLAAVSTVCGISSLK